MFANQVTAPSLARDASWLAASNIFYAVAQWSLIIAIARAVGPAAAGVYVLGSAIAGPIVGLSQLGLRQILLADTRAEFSYSTYFALRSSLSAAAFVLIGAIVFSFGAPPETVLTLLIVGAARCIESVLDIYYASLQKVGNYKKLAWTMTTASTLTLILAICGLLLTGSVAGAAAGFLIAVSSTIVVLVLTSWAVSVEGGWPTEKNVSDSFALAGRALPLGVASALVLLNSNLPRYALALSIGTSAVGQYVLVEQFVTAGALVINSVLQATLSELSKRFWAADRKQFRALVWKILGFVAAAGVCGVWGSVLVGRSLVELIYGTGHDEAIAAFPFVALAGTAIFMASAVGYAITATGRFVQMPIIYTVTVLATTLALYLLVPSLGLQGAALGHTIGYVVAIAMGVFVVFRR